MTRALRTLAIAVVWIALSASLVFLNKFILASTPFKYPLTLALVHMIVCALFCRALFLVAPHLEASHVRRPLDGSLTLRFCFIPALFALSLTCSNAALESLDVATIQILKAFNPAIIYVIGIAFKLESASPSIMSSIFTMCIGIVLTVRGSPGFHTFGLLLQTISICADSTRYICLQSMLHSQHLCLDALNVLHIVAPIAAMLLWIPASSFEFSHIMENADKLHGSLQLITLSCMLACCLNIVSNAFIRATSALNMSVAGVVKDVMMIALSVYVFGAHVSVVERAGFGITLASSGVYNWLRLTVKK